MTSAYLEQIHRNLPRLLASYDIDVTSDTYGVGDRYYWAWKLIDFPNGTFQGVASGLSGLLIAGLIPDSVLECTILDRIDAAVMAVTRVMSPNGSLAEAFPNEGSFCVTGLVAGDILLAVSRLGARVSDEQKDRWLSVIKPLIRFLHKQDEYHGIISNHLATNALALVRWTDITGENVDERAKLWIDRILANQSQEGWFREYEGCDPGYQTWCTSSLASIHKLRPSWKLLEPLTKSINFVAHAAHPDGSFGGLYGSRMTRFIFPASFELLSEEIPMAAALAQFSRSSISRFQCVTLDSIDAPNFVPIFNDYVSAVLVGSDKLEVDVNLPCFNPCHRTIFKDSGWLVDSGLGHYTVLNLKQGAAGIHFLEGHGHQEVTGVVAGKKGRIYTNQFVDEHSSWSLCDDRCVLQGQLCVVERPRPNALSFIVLRVLSLTVFRSISLGNIIKKVLVSLLVTKKSKSVGAITRTIDLGQSFTVSDELPVGFDREESIGFKPFHMASLGYWQRDD